MESLLASKGRISWVQARITCLQPLSKNLHAGDRAGWKGNICREGYVFSGLLPADAEDQFDFALRDAEDIRNLVDLEALLN